MLFDRKLLVLLLVDQALSVVLVVLVLGWALLLWLWKAGVFNQVGGL